MKRCPNCHKEIPPDNSTIYCPFCGEIVDDNVLLSQKVEKVLKENKEPAKKKEPVRVEADKTPPKRRDDEDYSYNRISDDDKKNPVIIALECVAVVVVVAAIWWFLKK